MAWNTPSPGSRMFGCYLRDVVQNLTAIDLVAGSFKVALYNNAITPDQSVLSAASAYNTGQWLTANEVSQAGQWAAGGVLLAGMVVNTASSPTVVWWDANDTKSGTAATLTNATGCLLYENIIAAPVANQGVCYNYFGGSNSVVNGTFTVLFNVLGIWRATL